MFACVQRHVAVYFSFHWMIAPVKQVAVAFFLLPVICNLFLLAAYRFTAENQFCYVENFLGLQVISCRKEWVSGTSSAHELKIISAYCRLCAQTVCSLHFFTNMRLSNRVLRFFFLFRKKNGCKQWMMPLHVCSHFDGAAQLKFIAYKMHTENITCKNESKILQMQSPKAPNMATETHKTLIYACIKRTFCKKDIV